MDIQTWLSNLGLERYVESFEENEVTVQDLPDLTPADLKNELGVKKLTDRKKLIAALNALKEIRTETTESHDWPEELQPAEMVTYLAHPWFELHQESHPRIQLHWLVDTAELIVRWTVAVAIAERLDPENPKLSPTLAALIRDHIERPTLGRWLLILRSISKEKRFQQLINGDLNRFVNDCIEPAFLAESNGGTIENSLLVLRNQVAHGGGLQSERAQHLLEIHYPTLCRLLTETKNQLEDVQILDVREEEVLELRGLSPKGIAPRVQPDTGTWLLHGDSLGLLMPIARYEPIQKISKDGELVQVNDKPVPMLYTRSGGGRLSYTPLGQNEAVSERLVTDHFRDLFRLDEALNTRKTVSVDAYKPDDFLKEARLIGEDLIGRRGELKIIKEWLKSAAVEQDHRAGWISGGPGSGKSLIMARLASDYGNSNHRGFYYHRFRGGDGRNNPKTFLRLLQAALWTWAPLRALTSAIDSNLELSELETDVQQRLDTLSQIPKPHPKAPAASFWIFLDGMDEITALHPEILQICDALRGPGRILLLAGRPDYGLAEFWTPPRATPLFEQGVPPMQTEDIRAMLLEGLGPARFDLLRRDQEESETVSNAFVDGVVERAHGLPLYVHLLLEDLRAGTLTVNDEKQLPDGLTNYYDALMDRMGMSTVKRDLPLVISLLARAEEPLTAGSLAELINRGSARIDRYLPRVEKALRSGRALVRQAPTSHGPTGWALYHQSFREYVGGSIDEHGDILVPPAPALKEVVEEADDLLVSAILSWKTLSADSDLRPYVLRHAVKDLIDANLQEEARQLLEDISFMLASKDQLESYAPIFKHWATIGEAEPQQYYRESLLKTARESTDRRELVQVLNFLEICVQVGWFEGMVEIAEVIAPRMLELLGPSDPETAHAHNKLGYLRYLHGGYKASLQVLEFNRKMIEENLEPGNYQAALVLNNLYLTHQALENHPEAIAICDLWIEELRAFDRSEGIQAQYYRAHSRYALGHRDEAIQTTRECIQFFVEKRDLYAIGYGVQLSRWLQEAGNTEEAYEAAESAFRFGRDLMGLRYRGTRRALEVCLELLGELRRDQELQQMIDAFGWLSD